MKILSSVIKSQKCYEEKNGGQMTSISHYIVSIVGVGYLIVGIQQYIKGNVGQGIMWVGYAIGQVGLFMGLVE